MASRAQKVAVKKKPGKKAAKKSAKKTAKKAAAPPQPELNPLMSLRDEMDKAFERFAAGWTGMSPYFQSLRDWHPFKDLQMPASFSGLLAMPRVDAGESADAYEVSAEIPGMDEKDIEVTVTDDSLIIKGEKKDERDTKEKDYHVTERSYGAFRRVLRIPDGVDSNKVSATFKNGVLKINLPKSSAAKTKQRQVTVKSG